MDVFLTIDFSNFRNTLIYMKKIIILLFFVSFSATGAGTNSSTDDSAKTSDQIIKLYELAEKHIDNQAMINH